MKLAGAVLLLAGGLLYAAPRDLEIYFVDTEGGAATLIITPSGESLLTDTGNPGAEDRDPKRIFAVTKLAGLTKLDYVLITHFDSDHSGGVPALVKMIPVSRFLDHGDAIDQANPKSLTRWQAYVAATEGKRTQMHPGDKIPLKGLTVEVVSSNGDVLAKPINGGKANPLCEGAEQRPPDKTENQRSLGFLMTYGKFKFLDLGDLTWDKEMELACPVNKVGTVTLYQPTWHGFANDKSGPPALVWAARPQIVVVNNGPRKGIATPALYDRIAKSPGVEGIWQSHLSLTNDKEHNTGEDMIANLEPTEECKGNWIKVTVKSNGHFTVTNGRNQFTKEYVAH